MATLDFKVGGKLAVDLENLYIFMIDKLVEGNIQNDPACLQSVEDLLGTLYVAWKDVIQNPRADGVPSQKLQPEKFKEYQQGISSSESSADSLVSGNLSSTSSTDGLKKGSLKVTA